MQLREYIELIGDEKASRLWNVKTRTAAAWRRGERLPRPEHAETIVQTSPVTYEGIYGAKEDRH